MEAGTPASGLIPITEAPSPGNPAALPGVPPQPVVEHSAAHAADHAPATDEAASTKTEVGGQEEAERVTKRTVVDLLWPGEQIDEAEEGQGLSGP